MSVSPLGDLLVSIGLITDDDRRTIIRECGRASQSFAKSIIRLGIVHEKDLPELINKRSGARKATKEDLLSPTKEALSLIDRNLMSKLEVLPLRTEMGRLLIAMADPLDRDTISQVQFFARKPVIALVANFSDIKAALAGHLGGTFSPSVPPLTAFLDRHKERIGANSALAIEDDEEELVIGSSSDDLDFDEPKTIMREAAPVKNDKSSKPREMEEDSAKDEKETPSYKLAPTTATAPKKEKGFGVDILDDLTTLEETDQAATDLSEDLELMEDAPLSQSASEEDPDHFSFDSADDNLNELSDNIDDDLAILPSAKSTQSKSNAKNQKTSNKPASGSQNSQFKADANIDDIDTSGLGEDMDLSLEESDQDFSTQNEEPGLDPSKANLEEIDETSDEVENIAQENIKNNENQALQTRYPSSNKRPKKEKPTLGLDKEILDMSLDEPFANDEMEFNTDAKDQVKSGSLPASDWKESTAKASSPKDTTNSNAKNTAPIKTKAKLDLPINQLEDDSSDLLSELDESSLTDLDSSSELSQESLDLGASFDETSNDVESHLDPIVDNSTTQLESEFNENLEALNDEDLFATEDLESNHLESLTNEPNQKSKTNDAPKRTPENLDLDFEMESEMPQKKSAKDSSRDAEKLEVIDFGDDLQDELGVSLSLNKTEKSNRDPEIFDEENFNDLNDIGSNLNNLMDLDDTDTELEKKSSVQHKNGKEMEVRDKASTKAEDQDTMNLDESMDLLDPEMNEISILGEDGTELGEIPISDNHSSIDTSTSNSLNESKVHQAMAEVNQAITTLMTVDSEKEANDCIVSAMRNMGAKSGYWVQLGKSPNGTYWNDTQIRAASKSELQLASQQNSSTWKNSGNIEYITIPLGDRKTNLAVEWESNVSMQIKNSVIPMFKALTKIQTL